MPFHRRFSRRSRPRRRRRRRPRRRMMRRRRVVLDPERKFTDRFPGSTAITFSGNVTYINGVVQGVDVTNRIGMQMLTLSSMISYTLRVNPTSNFAVDVRVALIHFKQPRGLNLALVDVWELIGTAAAVISPRVLQEALQYKILWKRTHRVSFQDPVHTRTVVRNHRIKTRFTGAGAGTGDTESGALFFVAVSTTDILAELPTLEFHSRVRFVG